MINLLQDLQLEICQFFIHYESPVQPVIAEGVMQDNSSLLGDRLDLGRAD